MHFLAPLVLSALFGPAAEPTFPCVSVPVVVYVDTAGDDLLGDGSSGNPFATIQRGLDALGAGGGTVMVRPGTYVDPATILATVRIAREPGSVGAVTLGPLPIAGSLLDVVGADDVVLEDLDLVGDADDVAIRLLSGSDRATIRSCSFLGFGQDAIRATGSANSLHRITACTFRAIRSLVGTDPAAAISLTGVADVEIASCGFSACDVGVRLDGCDRATVQDCRFVDLFHPALLVSDSDDLVVERCRMTRCGHLPSPASRVLPLEEIGTISLVSFSDRARIRDTVLEDCGGYTGPDSFRAGSPVLYEGLFAIGIDDCADTRVEDCSIHRNLFGGIHVSGASPGTVIVRTNLVANGSANDPGEDTALFTGGLAITATDNFWGTPVGPTHDDAGPGNGVDGGGVTTIFPLATAPIRETGFAFDPFGSVATGTRVVDVVVSDVDADGRADAIVVEDLDGTVHLHRQGPTGGLEPATPIGVFGTPVAAVTGRFDADTNVDLAVLDASDDSLHVLFGTGTGAFVPGPVLAVPRLPTRLRVGQLDGLPGDDLVVACRGDVFRSGGLVWLQNDGNGAFTTHALAGTVRGCDVEVLDLNADLRDDIVAFDLDAGGPGLRQYLRLGAGVGFAPVTARPIDAHPIEDATLRRVAVDGGAPDLAVATWVISPLPGASRIRIFRGTGTGTFSAPLLIDEQVGPVWLDSANFRGDSRAHLVALNPGTREVAIFGPFEASTTPFHTYAQTLHGVPLAAGTGDVTGDGLADLLIADASTSRLDVWRAEHEAHVNVYGSGCAGSQGMPIPRVQSLAEIGCETFGIAFENGPPTSIAALLFGADAIALPIPGTGACTLLVQPVLTLPVVSDPTGFGFATIPIPAVPSLSGGLPLYCQWVIVEPGGPALDIALATAGLSIAIGG